MSDLEEFQKWRANDAQTATTNEATDDPAQTYLNWREAEQEQKVERASAALRVAPDGGQVVAAVGRAEVAKANGMGEVPLDLLTNEKSNMSTEAAERQTKKQLRSSTRLAEWVAIDPINAALAREEMQNLSVLGGLIDRARFGVDRQFSSTWARRKQRRAEDKLTDIQNVQKDRRVGFGTIWDDVTDQIASDPDNIDAAAPAATIGKAVAKTLGRYVSSRLAFTSDESLQRYEAELQDVFERTLEDGSNNNKRLESSYGRSRNVAKVAELIGGIDEIETMADQTAALGAIIASEPLAFTEWLVSVAVESAPSIATAALATRATGRASSGVAAMGATSAAVGEAGAFDKLVRDGGYDLSEPEQRKALIADPAFRLKARDSAFMYGAVIGLMDAASGGVASQTLVKSGAGNLVLQSLAQSAMGAGGETLALMASDQKLNMAEIIVEGMAEFVTTPLEVTAVGGKAIKARREAQQDAQFFHALAQGAEGSEMRTKVPTKYREAVEALTKDGPVEALFVDAQALDELFQSAQIDVTAEQFLAAVTGVDIEAYQDALMRGGAVEIPTSSYATDIVGTDFDALIRDHLKTTPERMSVAEAREYEQQASELLEVAQKTVSENESGQRELEGVIEDARVELVSSLRRAGRAPDIAKREALQAVAFVRTTAQRLGITPDEFLRRYPLADVRSTMQDGEIEVTEAGELNQGGEKKLSDNVVKAMREDSTTGLKIGAKTRLWRGVNATSGGNSSQYGEGLYTTTSKSEAQSYADEGGRVVEMDHRDLPQNPLRFRTHLDFQLWKQRAQDALGVRGEREFGPMFPDIGDFVRSVDPDVDGIQVGTGRDAMYVKYGGRKVLYQSEPQEVFYSPLLRAVSNAKQAKAPAKDWKAIISKLAGIKKAEVDWLGVNDWLDQQEGQVTREDLVTYVAAHQIEIEEKTLAGEESELSVEVDYEGGEEPDDWAGEAEAYLDDARQQLEDENQADVDYEVSDEEIDELAEELARAAWEPTEYPAYVYDATSGDNVAEGYYSRDDGYTFDTLDVFHSIDEDAILAATGASDGAPNHEDYTEDGGDEYREILLTVPNLHNTGANAARQLKQAHDDAHAATKKFLADNGVSTPEGLGSDSDDAANYRELRDQYNALSSEAQRTFTEWRKQTKAPFVESAHFEQQNIVVHARVKDRAGSDAERILFAEEIQSDLASKWREASEPAEVTARRRELKADTDYLNARIGLGRKKLRKVAQRLAQDMQTARDAYAREQTVERYLKGVSYGQQVDEMDAQLIELTRILDGSEEIDRVKQEIAPLVVQHRAAGDELLRLGADKSTGEGLPDTPFKEELTYQLMIKRLLREAAEKGYDKLSWTPAHMQSRRWNTAAQNVVDGVSWAGNSEAKRVELQMSDDGPAHTVVSDAAGSITQTTNEIFAGKTLQQLVGPSLANRILDEDAGEVDGTSITFSDSGYSIAYDQQTRKAVDKLAKKHGAKTYRDTSLPDFGGGSKPLHNLIATIPHQEMLEWAIETHAEVAKKAEERANKAMEQAAAGIGEGAIAQYQSRIDDAHDVHAGDEVRAQQRVDAAEMQIAYVRAQQEARVAAAETRLKIELVKSFGEKRVREAFAAYDEVKEGEPVWSVDITDSLRAAMQEPQPLFQKKRGSIILPREQGAAPIVSLFEHADLSTFLHESGHYYLHVLQDLAQRGDQSDDIATDWQTINEWWSGNVEGIAADGGVTQEQVAAYLADGTTGDAEVDNRVNVGLQEQWARAYETYLLEGKAPSNALRSAFEAFNAWLLAVYRNMKGDLNVQINDELRGVFDRLLATDEEIAAVAAEGNVDQLVAETAEAMGIDGDEFAKLVRLGGEAQDEARQQLLGDIMAPIRRERTQQYRAERDKVRAEIADRVNKKPANRVREWLTNERWFSDGGDAEAVPNPSGLPLDLRINRQSVIDTYGRDTLDALPRGRRPMVTRDTTLTADDVAGWFGYKSGSEMLDDVMTAPSPAKEIDNLTRAEMRARHGDPLSDGAVEELAVKALHGEKRGQLIAAELRALSKNARRGKPTTKAQAQEIARRTMRSMPIRKAVRSGQYLAAERRAAERSQQFVARGDIPSAFEAKREQLLNHALFVESKKADELLAKTERKVARLKSKGTRKNLAGEYLEAIDDILTSYDFRKSTTQRGERRREGLTRYVKMMQEAGRENELAIPSYVLDEAQRKPYRTLTSAQLEGVYDSLRNIEHTARMKKKLRDAQDERDFQEVVDGVVASVNDNIADAPRNRVKTAKEKLKDGTREFANLLLSADTILRKLDGFLRGAAYDAIKAPIDAASDAAQVMRGEAADKFAALYAPYSSAEQNRMGVKRHVKLLGGSFSKWDMISMALNMGNADNMARLMDRDSGGGFNQAQIDYVKSQLSAKDWQFVQNSLDLINGYWPLIEARERRLTGVAPKKVRATEIETPFGTIAGGYYPIKYDGDLSGIVAEESIVELQKQTMAGRFGKAQTKNGHLEERASGSGGRVLQLGVEVMHSHVGHVIQDLAFSEAVAVAWRVLRAMQPTMEAKGLLKDHKTLELWLQDVAVGQIAAGGVMSRVALRAKNGFTLSKLAFNMSTVLVQITGVAQSAVVVGKKNLAKGYSTYLSDPQRWAREIKEMSPFMAERETTFNRDINDVLGDVTKGPTSSKLAKGQHFVGQYGFWLMQKVQFYGVDVPTWLAGYEQGLQLNGNDEAKARRHADRMVARAQASGVFADRSAFERGTASDDLRQNGFIRLFTTLGSYMFAKGNIAYEVYGKTRKDAKAADNAGRAAMVALAGATDMALLFTVEAIAYNLIKGTLPEWDGDDDEEGWTEFLAKETALSMMSTVPFVRDLGSSLSGFDAGAYGSVIATFSAPLIQVLQGEADLALFKTLSSAVGTVTGLPTGQLNKTVNAWYRLEQGDDISPVEFLMGANR